MLKCNKTNKCRRVCFRMRSIATRDTKLFCLDFQISYFVGFHHIYLYYYSFIRNGTVTAEIEYSHNIYTNSNIP